MNCKPNQRAMFTRDLGEPENRKYLGMVFVVRRIHNVEHPKLGPMWEVDPDNKLKAEFIFQGIPQRAGWNINFVCDVCLTPLPDDDLEDDEVITNELVLEQ